MAIIASTILDTDFGEFRVNYHKLDSGFCLSFVMGDVKNYDYEPFVVIAKKLNKPLRCKQKNIRTRTKMKKQIYIFFAMVLGVLLTTIIHAVLEMWYISLFIANPVKYGLGLSWQPNFSGTLYLYRLAFDFRHCRRIFFGAEVVADCLC